MRRLILVLASIGVAVLLANGAALGITNGHPDEGKHPYVGALVEFPKEGKRGEPYPYCTGTLISDTVFLTAAHCGDDGEAVNVTFKEEGFATLLRTDSYAGTFHAHSNLDIAVVQFTSDIAEREGLYPTELPNLPAVGQFDDAQKGDKFTAVGYGGYLAPKEPGGPIIVYDDKREWAVGTLSSVTRTYLRLSQNKDNGGTCYGDSGGPNFLGEYGDAYDLNHPPTIASITITGDAWCKTTNVTLRLDTASVRAFLDD